jgi:hypothetical protein
VFSTYGRTRNYCVGRALCFPNFSDHPTMRKCQKHAKPFPCGPCRIESSKRPAQTPALPLGQLTATANEVNVVSEAFGLVRREKPKLTVRRKKQSAQKTPTAREQYNLTRREIAELLDMVGVETALTPEELQRYRDLAAGNLSEKGLATQIGMRDAVGVEVYISDLETRVIRKALFLGVRLQPQTKVDTDTFDRTMDGERAAEGKAISESGGELIGGSVITRGYGTTPGTTFSLKPLDSFERGGKMVRETGDFAASDTSNEVDFDDYGEDSSA